MTPWAPLFAAAALLAALPGFGGAVGPPAAHFFVCVVAFLVSMLLSAAAPRAAVAPAGDRGRAD
jgi:uncharacterized membrane protein YtjA (UPF0391 family)